MPISRNVQLVDELPTPTSHKHSTTLMAATNLSTTCPLHPLSLLSISIKSAYSTRGGSMLALRLLNRVMAVFAGFAFPPPRVGRHPASLPTPTPPPVTS